MVTNIIPREWNAFPSNPIFVVHWLPPSKNNFFFAMVLLHLTYFLHGNPKGTVLIFFITLGVITTDRPFTIAVAWNLVRGMSERGKSLATSSSSPLIHSKSPIHSCFVKIYTIGGCWWILTMFVGSILLKPPIIFPW